MALLEPCASLLYLHLALPTSALANPRKLCFKLITKRSVSSLPVHFTIGPYNAFSVSPTMRRSNEATKQKFSTDNRALGNIHKRNRSDFRMTCHHRHTCLDRVGGWGAQSDGTAAPPFNLVDVATAHHNYRPA